MRDIAMFIFWCFVIAFCLKGCEALDHVQFTDNGVEWVGEVQKDG